jgi:hypothetical protein
MESPDGSGAIEENAILTIEILLPAVKRPALRRQNKVEQLKPIGVNDGKEKT